MVAAVPAIHISAAELGLSARRETPAVQEVAAGTSHHGLAPEERGLLPTRWPCIVQRPTTTSVARCAPGKFACCSSSREASSTVARSHARDAKCWLCTRRQPTRCTTVSRRRREASRRYSRLVWCADLSQPALHGARALQAGMLRLLPIDSKRSGALTHVRRKSRLCGRPQSARRTTVLHRRRERSRRRSGLM